MSYRLKPYLFAVIAFLCMTMTGSAIAATTTITANATIQTASLTLTPVTNLNFGTIVVTGGANILIDATGGAAASAVDSGLASITVPGTSGLVQVDSPVDATVNITYTVADSTSAADKLDDGATHTMDFTAASMHTYSTGGGTNPGTLALTAGTTGDLHIGGLLQIGAAQTPGAYSGTITVNVNY
ncbi:MAG: DUF4402 domain-containing protein [Desulfobacter sp.]|nr:DUF4402 domain-containing protein [Desulfobacter sp.]WDP83811.1 MAG: DUF4402 domain-containing protein [Desulfobacter sp.]